jgi:hypothetical protein
MNPKTHQKAPWSNSLRCCNALLGRRGSGRLRESPNPSESMDPASSTRVFVWRTWTVCQRLKRYFFLHFVCRGKEVEFVPRLAGKSKADAGTSSNWYQFELLLSNWYQCFRRQTLVPVRLAAIDVLPCKAQQEDKLLTRSRPIDRSVNGSKRFQSQTTRGKRSWPSCRIKTYKRSTF